jgi:hypothetical protein
MNTIPRRTHIMRRRQQEELDLKRRRSAFALASAHTLLPQLLLPLLLWDTYYYLYFTSRGTEAHGD